MIKKVKLFEGNLPVLSVVESTIPRVFERIIKFMFDYAVDYRTLNDEKDGDKYLYPPAKAGTFMVTIGTPLLTPRIHEKSNIIGSVDIEYLSGAIETAESLLSADKRIVFINIMGSRIGFVLLVDELNELVLNLNIYWHYQREIFTTWYSSVLEIIAFQKILAEKLTVKIGCPVKVGRYMEHNDVLLMDGKKINNDLFIYYEKMLTQPIINRVVDK